MLGLSNAFIVKPANIGKFVAQLFARDSQEVADALHANVAEQITKLEKADEQLAIPWTTHSVCGPCSALRMNEFFRSMELLMSVWSTQNSRSVFR